MMMPHTFDHYQITTTNVGGGHKRTASSLIQAGVPCFFQDQISSNMASKISSEREDEPATCFLLDAAAFAAIEIFHVVRVAGDYYRVAGKKDLAGLNRVFRLDLVKDQNLPTTLFALATGGIETSGGASVTQS